MKKLRFHRSLAVLCAVGLAAGLLTATPAPAAAAQQPQQPSASLLIPQPEDDPFYEPAPGYESAAPGTILKQRDVRVFGIPAQQLQVRSTGARGQPVTVVSTVIVPPGEYPGDGPRPLLSYQVATDSLGDQCSPSYRLRTLREKEFALLSMGLAKGWSVVVTDYQGPKDAYGAGRMAGHAVLDGIRAATSLPGLGDSPVGLWGYSGGALATGWAAQLQPRYAPELTLAGVASGGTPANLKAAARQMSGGPFAGLAIAAVIGLSRAHPKLGRLFNEAGQHLLKQAGDLCVGQLAARYAFDTIEQYTTSDNPLSEPLASKILARNTMGRHAPEAPVYMYHSYFDELVPYSTAKKLANQWCAQGTRVSFYTDYLSEHNVLAVTGAPAALHYLSARFAGQPAPSTC